jgi:DNA processing protein
LLKEIPDPPSSLFVRGDFSCLTSPASHTNTSTKFLCVVGTRRASQYGIDACRSIIEGLQGQDIVIVSGLAIGIDTVAHESALSAGLKTVAVLCSGLEWQAIYPRQNERLAKEIVAAGGALVSEFSDTYRPHPFNFPERNRVMAGLSHAILVIEATEKSGTLITARMALDYNRDVLAVPGSIFSEQSIGPNNLISNGAIVVTSSSDLLRTFNIKHSETNDQEINLSDLNQIESKIYKLLKHPLSRADLLQNFTGDIKEVAVAISALEIKGLIIESEKTLRRKRF